MRNSRLEFEYTDSRITIFNLGNSISKQEMTDFQDYYNLYIYICIIVKYTTEIYSYK